MSGAVDHGKKEILDGATGITDPRETDVLCGRGGAALRHPGNQTYRRLVNLNKGLYITCLKTEKLKISRSIVAAIREQNGRFLEKDSGKSSWFDIGDKKAIEKTSQALREGQPKLRQKIVEMGGGAAGTAALMEQQFGANGMYSQNAPQAHGQVQHVHQARSHSLQQQAQNIRGFDGGMGIGVGGGQQMGASMSAGMVGRHHSSMAPASRQQGQQQQQQFRHHHHLQGQQQRASSHNNSQSHQQQQRQLQQPQLQQPRMSNQMAPPQARHALHNEMMRLSMHGDDDLQKQQQQQQQNRSAISSETASLRPSLVKRGSAAAAELGIQSSNMSLMSDYSSFGNSNHGGAQLGSIYGLESARRGIGASSHGDPFGGGPNPYQNQDMDRRRIFAKMKYARPPSDRMSGRQIGGASAHSLGDGMPDFHMVESQLSLYSNLSGMTGGDSKRPMAEGEAKRPPPGDMLGGAGSRHSIMSGLSRISDASEVHSIFSDLSRKIGNVSTRSIAMSEISGIDAYRGVDGDSDSTPSFGEAETRATPSAAAMDFDVENMF